MSGDDWKAETDKMNTKTIVLLFAISVVVMMMTIDKANAQRPGRCRRPCTGGPDDICKRCARRCTPSCQNPNPPCRRGCDRNVCQCRDGFLRAFDGRCYSPSACPLPPSSQG